MPLTNNGFNRDEFDDIRSQINDLFTQYFGEDIDLSDSQVEGLLAGILTTISNKNEQLAEAIYYSNFISLSSGVDLDNHGTDMNLFRKNATPSYVDLQITAYIDQESPTIIPEESYFSTPDAQRFKTTSELTITQITGTDDDGNNYGIGTIQAVSVESGPENNVVANSIINPEEALDNFISVTNPNGATGGTNSETDKELQLRLINNNVNKPNGTKNGIETAIKNINGVKDAKLIANNEMIPDQFNNPAKSHHLYVIGGDNETIATTYFEHLAPAAKTIGNIQVEVSDVGEKNNLINFDKAKTVSVYFQIKLEVDDTVFNSDEGINQIKQNIFNYFDNFTMGSILKYSKLFSYVWSIKGINDVDIKVGIDQGNLKQEDISPNQFELLNTSDKNISIEIK